MAVAVFPCVEPGAEPGAERKGDRSIFHSSTGWWRSCWSKVVTDCRGTWVPQFLRWEVKALGRLVNWHHSELSRRIFRVESSSRWDPQQAGGKRAKLCQGAPMSVVYITIKLLIRMGRGKDVLDPHPSRGDPLTSPGQPTPAWLWLGILEPYAGLFVEN